ncbi:MULTISPECIES: type VI secretion system lipoprotein TssJ [Caballeronia]|jgi:type VI secretion system protein VasD|uniref:type VI secretion system lipoprotein TssJ n=1 Tax=Caballeronia TaxID=1827195 RepID=UPI00158BB004|nr:MULTISPECIES: type VI secretion system lipoprotein TssJ [Caballeronia]MCG7404284.1 type VI secretion system lipoprotein TssJ [Caballeronia zhejiangensis]MCI1045825.1 type VI secretion system lipoprotein TssJ [Caballeronia zhejiangensis]MDR5798297.1 type VI secretion system lipoprotein TssJ [Caballeronia sp. LZ008]
MMSKPNQMACAVLLILGLSGCGLWQATSDGATSAYQAMTDWRVKAVDVDMRARADLNPDASGHPHPVAVRVYQLKDRARFDSASFNELLHHDRSVLGRDLQASVSAVVNPGASASVSQPMQKETAFIAIAAFYRNADQAGGWKQVIAARKLPDDAPVKLTLADSKLDMESKAKAGKK